MTGIKNNFIEVANLPTDGLVYVFYHIEASVFNRNCLLTR